MKTIKLQATGIEFEVPDNFYFHDDGVVKSIANHEAELCRRYKAQYKYNYKQRLGEMLRATPIISKLFKNMTIFAGSYADILPEGYFKISDAIRDKREIHTHIFVLGGYSKSKIIQWKGHEETHIVLNHNQGNLLEKGLESIGIGNNGFEELPEEAKCDLGGIYAVIRNNLPNQRIELKRKNISILNDYLYRNSSKVSLG